MKKRNIRNVKYEMKAMKKFGKDNMRRRKIHDAIRIERQEGVTLNSRAEHNQPLLPRPRINTNINRE